LEEVQHRRVPPVGRVRHVDHDLGTLERFGQSLAGDDVHASVRRRRQRVVAVRAQLCDELRPDQAGPADYDDLHRVSFLSPGPARMGPGRVGSLHAAGHPVAWTAARMTRVTTDGLEMRDRCPALTSVMWAPARLAMNV